MAVANPSSAFKDALRYGSVLCTARFTVYQLGVPVGAPYTAAMSTGSVTVDRNSNQRRTGNISLVLDPTIPPPTLMPVSPSSLLAPFGTEIYLEVGITSTGNLANIQWVPLGLFTIITSDADDTVNNLVVTLDLQDRSWVIADRKLKTPYNFPATPSGNFVDEIEALLNQVWNQQQGVAPLEFNIVPTDATVPVASYNQGSDPWQACLDMAAAIGYELFFNAYGVVTGYPVPNPLTQPVIYNFTDDQAAITGLGGTGSAALFGGAYSTPIAVQIGMTRSGIYNDVIIQGTGTANMPQYTGVGTQASGPPILAEAAVTDPSNAMYIGGAMGDVPNFVSSSLVTASGAQQMANTDLQVALSSAWTCTLTSAPNPILDVDDVVSVTRPRVGLSGALMVIDTITHAIRYADSMAVTGRLFYVPATSS